MGDYFNPHVWGFFFFFTPTHVVLIPAVSKSYSDYCYPHHRNIIILPRPNIHPTMKLESNGFDQKMCMKEEWRLFILALLD